MKYFYAIFLFAEALMMLIGCAVEKKKDKSPVGRTAVWLMGMGFIAVSSYAAGIISSTGIAAKVFYSIYFSTSDWVLFCMLAYSIRHTENKHFVQQMWVTAVIALLDSVSLLLNIFLDHCFTCVYTEDITGAGFYSANLGGVFYTVHRIFVTAIFISSVAVLFYRVVKTPKIYHRRVLTVLVSLVVVVAVNMCQGIFKFKMDPSLAFYGLIAFAVFYYSILYVPTDLIDSFLTSVAKNMDGSLICFDIDKKCIFANETAFRLYRAEKNVEKLNAGYEQWLEDNPEGNTRELTWKEHRVIGGRNLYATVQYKHLKDKSGKNIGSFFLLRDETEEMQKIAEERYRMTHDELTGIYNKKYFIEKTEELLEHAQNGEYCMVSADVRDFKLINDIFGMATGDDILIEIAQTIKKFAKEGTVYGRISGDRYAICMPYERYSDELFREEIERLSHLLDSGNYQMRLHIGVYRIANVRTAVSVIIDRANMALRSIKYSYTETVAHYDEKMRAARLSEQRITAEFDQAIAEGQFRMFLQPQISSATGQALGAEALVRWEHPERGMIPPAEFIGVFERTGLIARMDSYVWELACKKLREWKQEGRGDYHISVNISPKDFFFTDIYKTFTELVKKYEIDPKNLKLEITETAIMNDFSKQLSLIGKLREYGFAVEMDDFGSGYSSLNMLKDIHVDTLKIDMGFLRDTANVSNADRSITIINMIIALSKKLGMEVITEGVETKEQVDFLTTAGCDVFQGYYFAKPMRVSEFETKYF